MNAAVADRTVTSGNLERTPISHLLVFLHEKRLSGSLEVVHEDESAMVSVIDGAVTKVQTSRPVAYLGALLYEQGVIDAEELNASLADMARERKLHGQVLIERRSITSAALDKALVEQTVRKLTHVLSFPKTAHFSFHHDIDRLADSRGGPAPLDPLPAIWRAARETPPWDQVNAVIERIGRNRIRLRADAAIARFDFFPEESAVVEELFQRPMSVAEIAELHGFGERRAKLLAYGLLLAKQIELVAAEEPGSGLRESMSMRAAPASSGVVRSAAAAPPSTGRYVIADTVHRSSGSMKAAQEAPASGTIPLGDPIRPPSSTLKSGVPVAATTRSFAPAIPPSSPSVPLARTTPPVGSSGHLRAAAPAGSAAPPAEERLSPSQSYVRRSSSPVQLAVTAPEGAAGAGSAPMKRDIDAELAGLPVRTLFEGAKLCLSRGDVPRAERLCRLAEREERDKPEIFAMLAWLEALRPENQSVEATRRRIHMLDRAISGDEDCESAYFWRAQLHKRIENHGAALRDFRRVLDINARHPDAMREVRLYEMRIRNHSLNIRSTTPAAGTRRMTPGGMAAVKSK